MCSVTEYEKLLEGFEKELEVIDFNNLSPDGVINTLYFLFLKYLWCVPSAVYKDEPDISLFDHLKTTAAIAGCLYIYHQEYPNKLIDIESPAFLLVGGDISGIQAYIFDVLTQEGKVAKRLRARSLFVQIISEIATHRIIHKFGFPLCNIISSAGGNFYVLLPNSQDAKEKLQELQAEFDKMKKKDFVGIA